MIKPKENNNNIQQENIDIDLENVSFAFSKQSSEGITKEDIEDIKRFVEYRKNKNERK